MMERTLNTKILTPNKDRATIIVIDGCDGTGKETQSKLIGDYLRAKNIPVLNLSFPNYKSTSSFMVREYLNGAIKPKYIQQKSTFLALDRSLTMCEDEVQEYLKNPKAVVICDRYTASSFIYDTIDIENIEDVRLAVDEIQSVETTFLHVPISDLTILLDLGDKFGDQILKERQADKNYNSDIVETDTEMMKKVRTNIRRLANDPIIASDHAMVLVKCNDNDEVRLSVEDVFVKVMKEIDNVYKIKLEEK